jgi:polyribonucleotide nucleotidyltransferase
MIRSIIEQTGVKIDVSDDGRVNIASSDGLRPTRLSRSYRD